MPHKLVVHAASSCLSPRATCNWGPESHSHKPNSTIPSFFLSTSLLSLQLSSWQEWFVLLGRECPSPQVMSDLLRWAWCSGVAKGYHSKTTNWAAIQKSGVSRILLKGQSYAMPPTAKKGERGWWWCVCVWRGGGALGGG